jgi:glycosyltransferase involved in cell wall biosynthesis
MGAPESSASARLALFLPRLDDGGAERVMLQLGAGFAARGHDVDLVVAIPGGPLESHVSRTIRIVDLASRRSVAALPALTRYLRKRRPQALLSTLEHSNILAVWAGALARARTRIVLREASVLLPRDQMHGLRPHLQRALMRRVYPAASAIVAVSKSVERELIDGLGIAESHVRTIYNPVVEVDLDARARAPLDDDWYAPGAPPVILAVGRLAPAKDFPTLLRAFAAVRARRPTRLLILGEGKDRASLVSVARELAIEEHVRLPGYDRNPFRYMRRSPVFVLSSIYEGLPGALIQAMACGCRVVSTDCPGGSREILEASASPSSGLLVPPRDPPALAEAILTLLAEADKNPGRVEHHDERFGESASIDAYLVVLGARAG